VFLAVRIGEWHRRLDAMVQQNGGILSTKSNAMYTEWHVNI